MSTVFNQPIKIDLNAVREDRVVTYLGIAERGLGTIRLEPGYLVRVIEEEGDSYFATVQSVDGARVELVIDFDTLAPSYRFEWDITPEITRQYLTFQWDIEAVSTRSIYMPNDEAAPQRTERTELVA